MSNIEELNKIREANIKENKKILKLISNVVYDTVSYMKEEYAVYQYEPELKTVNDGDSVSIHLEYERAFIDEEYIVDQIFEAITGEDADGVR